MESVLDNHERVKQCYSKYGLEEIRKMDAKTLRSICLPEREAFADSFTKLDMKIIIDERINILKLQAENKYNQRMAELKNYYKL
jgi:hypothetical protein